ncbi:MAG: hypothetical protein U5L45_00445 [Saprospiraceae bacterium]|nr:hypothetical protein [Saprospiraceae bacterium]
MLKEKELVNMQLGMTEKRYLWGMFFHVQFETASRGVSIKEAIVAFKEFNKLTQTVDCLKWHYYQLLEIHRLTLKYLI